ncbi:MAG: hypothetical protein WC444_05090 [Candidatus Paceibacterota bacterium]
MKDTVIRECVARARKKIFEKRHPQIRYHAHFTFVVQDNAIVEVGYNRSADPLIYHGYPKYGKIHSETDAYRKAKGILNQNKTWEVLNVRMSKKGILKNSKPCPCCSAYLRELGCRDVWFTTGNGIAKMRLNT